MATTMTRHPFVISVLILTLIMGLISSGGFITSAAQQTTGTPEGARDMSPDDLEAAARELNEAYNDRDWDAWIALTSPDVELVTVPTGQTFQGHAGAREFIDGWATAFPDSRIETGLVIANDAAVGMEWTGRGTHDGPLVTPAGTIPPTGQSVELAFTQFLEFEDGLIVRGRLYFDLASMLQQLGVVAAAPAPNATPSSGDARETPGILLRSEPFTRAIPDGATGWRIEYVTSRADDTPVVSSALVIAPSNPPDGPRPVIAFAHGSTGSVQACAPSEYEDPFAAGGFPGFTANMSRMIEEGKVIVAPDEFELGSADPHRLVAGEDPARFTLDAIRAAMQMHELSLANTVAIWGMSQGADVALWSGAIASGYAPELDLVGVAAIAPAVDLAAFMSTIAGTPGGNVIVAHAVSAYSQVYPDVVFEDLVLPDALEAVQALADACIHFSGPEAETFMALVAETPVQAFVADLTVGAFGERLEENSVSATIDVPVFFAQGLADTTVPPTLQLGWMEEQCGAGQVVTRHTYEEHDHFTILAPDSQLIPDLLSWTEARLAGEPAPAECATIAG